MRSLTSQFWFTAGAPDCQDLLKHEITTRHPHLRLAFSRPGLVTFKSEIPIALDAQPVSHLAALSGLSIGSGKTLEEVTARIVEFFATSPCPNEPAAIETQTTHDQRPWAALCSIRAFPWPTEEDAEAVQPGELGRAQDILRRTLAIGPPTRESPSREATCELGVLVPPPGRESWGYFAFARPAGAPPLPAQVSPPPEAPSRAYAKLVEAIAHFDLTLRSREVALELGAAPGGATFALLERGVSVIAVDPAEMDARLAPFAKERGLVLRHVRKGSQALEAPDLAGIRGPVRWLISDMNVAPPVSAQYVLRARSLIKATLGGAILTLKLNDTAAVDTLPRVLSELERAFGRAPRVAHLPSHRREVVAVFAD